MSINNDDEKLQNLQNLKKICEESNRGGLCFIKDEKILALKPSQICGEEAFDTVYKKRNANPDRGIWLSLHKYWIIPLIVIGVIIVFGFLAYIGYKFNIFWLFVLSIILGLIVIGISSVIIDKATGGNIVGGVVTGYYASKNIKQYDLNKCMQQVDRYAKAYINSPVTQNELINYTVTKSNKSIFNKGDLADNDLIFFYTNKGRWNEKWSREMIDKNSGDSITQKFSENESLRLTELEGKRREIEGAGKGMAAARFTGGSNNSSSFLGSFLGAILGAMINNKNK